MNDKDDSQRKATDVLLEIEKNLNILLKTVITIDYNQKILSNKLNNLLEEIQTFKQPTVEATNTKIVAPIKAMVAVSDKPAEIIIKPTSIKTHDGFIDTEKTNKSRKKVETPLTEEFKDDTSDIKDESKNASIPVKQKITGISGKSIFLANVEIKDINNKLVCNTKTKANGNWEAILVPGKYFVFIKKQADSLNEKIDLQQEIEISGNKPVILTEVKIKN